MASLRLQAFLARENNNYDLYLMRWEVFKVVDTQPAEMPVISTLGSLLDVSLAAGAYEIVYSSGLFANAFRVQVTDEHINKVVYLDAGVLIGSIGPNADNTDADADLELYSKNKGKTIGGYGMIEYIVPADEDLRLEGRIHTGKDEPLHAESVSFSVRVGEVKRIHLVANISPSF